IINFLGQVVYANVFNGNMVNVPVDNLANGVYFVKVNGVYVERLVKE
ncbi:MAG: T9SS type A sorting domain-containing protein, partial [Taibaiella sp.]|nr:T9SS type A sorting domain-containing protein [Taibaiella sp.]